MKLRFPGSEIRMAFPIDGGHSAEPAIAIPDDAGQAGGEASSSRSRGSAGEAASVTIITAQWRPSS